MEDEFYNLVVKGNDLKTYIRRFQELAVLFPNMVPNTEKLMEVFIRGLPRSIVGNVTASKPQTLEEAITITQRLMEQITATITTATITTATMITANNKMEGRKPSRLMETVDIMDLITSVESVHCITQDSALSGVKIVTK
ncbi:hypothetical protein Tco_0031323 [Tanacetum coccineum]